MKNRTRVRLTYWVEDAGEGIETVHLCHVESDRPMLSFTGGFVDLEELEALLRRMTLTTPPKQTEERGKA